MGTFLRFMVTDPPQSKTLRRSGTARTNPARRAARLATCRAGLDRSIGFHRVGCQPWPIRARGFVPNGSYLRMPSTYAPPTSESPRPVPFCLVPHRRAAIFDRVILRSPRLPKTSAETQANRTTSSSPTLLRQSNRGQPHFFSKRDAVSNRPRFPLTRGVPATCDATDAPHPSPVGMPPKRHRAQLNGRSKVVLVNRHGCLQRKQRTLVSRHETDSGVLLQILAQL